MRGENTQRNRVLRALQNGERVTSLDAYNKLGITQLGARVWELREKGYNIVTERVKGKNRFGETISFCEYKLVKEDIHI